MDPGTWMAIATVVSTVGQGYSYYTQTQASKSADAIASVNAQAGLESARARGESAQMQATMASVQAQKDQEAAQNNAAAIESQAEMQTRVAQENIRKARMAFEAKLGQSRSQSGGSGILDSTGSPLEFLVASAADESLLESEMRWQDETDRTASGNAIQNERLKAGSAGINAGLYSIQGLQAAGNARVEATQLNLNMLGERARNRGQRMAALGELGSSIGSNAFAIGSNWKQFGTKKT